MRAHPARLARQPRQLRIEERHIEGGVVDHELRAGEEAEQLRGDFREARLAVELGARDAVHGERALVDVALGIQIAMEGAPARAAVDELDAADLDDAMIELGLEAGGFRVEDDLAHGPRVYRNAWPDNASIAALARRSTRSLPGTPAWPGTQCHSS